MGSQPLPATVDADEEAVGGARRAESVLWREVSEDELEVGEAA